MIYQIGDKFLVEGVEGEVFYVNNGMAWLKPIEGDWRHVCYARLDEYGVTQKGNKALAITNKECQAV